MKQKLIIYTFIMLIVIIVTFFISLIPGIFKIRETSNKRQFIDDIKNVYNNVYELIEENDLSDLSIISNESNILNIQNEKIKYCILIKNNEIKKILISDGKYIIDSNIEYNKLTSKNVNNGTLDDFNCDDINLDKYMKKYSKDKKEVYNDLDYISEVENRKITIIDKTTNYCPQAIEYFYSDNNYLYYFNCIKSKNVYIIKENKEYLLSFALKNKIVSMKELNDSGYYFHKKEKMYN